MARTVMVYNNPTLKVATTLAGLSAGMSVECQVTSAIVSAVPQFNSIPSTGCAPAVQSPGQTGWQLELQWLQDWKKPTAQSLSQFAFANDAKEVFFELTPDSTDTTVKITGDAYCTSGPMGAVFGDGSPAAAT